MAILKTSTVHGNLTVTGVINGITAGGSGGTIDKLTNPVTINITGGATGSVSTDFSISPININITSLDASKLSGTITATKLATARTIGLSGVTATAQSFDGSTDITIGIVSIPGSLLTGSTTINTTGSAGTLNGTQNGVTTTISAENSSYTYYRSTSSDGHWFNKDVVINGSIYPSRDTSGNRNLGLSNSKWDNIYATTFNGNLIGSVTGNIIGNVTGDISGNATTASKPLYTSIPNLATQSLANYVTAGHYMCITNSVINVTDIPTGINSSFLLIVDETTIDSLKVISQVIISNGKIYFRVSPVNSTTWPTWKSLIPDEASATVSGIVTTGEQTFGGAKHFPDGISSYAIEFTDISSTAGNGGYIDFHFNGSATDYTSRIIEDSSGTLRILGNLALSSGGALTANRATVNGPISGRSLAVNTVVTCSGITAATGTISLLDSSTISLKVNDDSPVSGQIIAKDTNIGIATTSHFIPDGNAVFNLGNASNKFNEGYINHVIGYADAAASPTYITIPSNADLNNYQTKGHYICGGDVVAATVVNNPTVSYSFAMDVIDTVSENNIGYKMQIVYQYNNGFIYNRIYDYGGGSIPAGWSTWQRLARITDIPGLASESNNGLISTGTQNIAGIKTFSSGIITPNIITSLSEYYTALGNVSGSVTIAFVSSSKNIVTMTCTAATTLSFTQTGAYSSGAYTYTLVITNGGGKVTWPSTVKWADGTPPELTTSGTDIITLLSLGGANLYYAVAATNFS